MIRVGCCGFQKAQRVYYDHFRLIEIQQTFYRLPLLKTAHRWREEAPEGFIFTMKALQTITHEPYQPTYRRSGLDIPASEWKNYGSFRPTDQVQQAWEDSRAIAEALQAPIVVFQCPPQFTPTTGNLANLRVFFRRIERGKLTFAWEPRGEWPNELVKSLCEELNLIHCVDPFVGVSMRGDPVFYYRMHGGADYSYQFSDADLAQLATLCLEQGNVYCLFNNVTMWDDALRFKEVLTEQKIEVE